MLVEHGVFTREARKHRLRLSRNYYKGYYFDQDSDIANYTDDLECPREDDLDLCATFIEEYFSEPVTAAAALAMQSGAAAAGR